MKKIELLNAYRSRREYRADLYVYGTKVGEVWRDEGKGGGYRARDYKVRSEGVIITTARTMAELMEDLNEWIEEERQMEHQAIWLSPDRNKR
jgi:hypothetical protein